MYNEYYRTGKSDAQVCELESILEHNNGNAVCTQTDN